MTPSPRCPWCGSLRPESRRWVDRPRPFSGMDSSHGAWSAPMPRTFLCDHKFHRLPTALADITAARDHTMTPSPDLIAAVRNAYTRNDWAALDALLAERDGLRAEVEHRIGMARELDEARAERDQLREERDWCRKTLAEAGFSPLIEERDRYRAALEALEAELHGQYAHRCYLDLLRGTTP